jgi:hypothetical protein
MDIRIGTKIGISVSVILLLKLPISTETSLNKFFTTKNYEKSKFGLESIENKNLKGEHKTIY